jgi:putative transposase
MVRGIEGVKIFRDDQDRTDLLDRIDQLVPKTGTRILAWALMDNHAHFLLFSGPSGISRFMRCLLTGYASGFNRRHRRKGHLFQNRYKSIVCEEDPYLLELVRYIHLNPLRGGIVAHIGELDRYPWSGHAVLVGRHQAGWQDRDYVLGQFGPDRRRAEKAYRTFVEEANGRGRRDELSGGGLVRSFGGWSQVRSLRGSGENLEHDPRVLGRGDFVEQIILEADAGIRRQLRNGERKKLIDRVIREQCQKESVLEMELRQGSQRRKVSTVRAKVAYLLNRERGISCAEIARNLGVSTTAIIKAVERTNEGMIGP